MTGVPENATEPFVAIYRLLIEAYGPRRWWPVTPEGGEEPVYSGGPGTKAQVFEVAVGAVLTQNTAWKNAARAIAALNRNNMLSPERLAGTGVEKLAGIIRSSGYYNQKAGRLKGLAAHFMSTGAITRESLLGLNGIGPETADSIMLYAFREPYFVVDAYTRRVFGRLGLVEEASPYETIRGIFEMHIPRDVDIYQEYHALIVEHGKRFCRKVPECSGCPLRVSCPESKKETRRRAGNGKV